MKPEAQQAPPGGEVCVPGEWCGVQGQAPVLLCHTVGRLDPNLLKIRKVWRQLQTLQHEPFLDLPRQLFFSQLLPPLHPGEPGLLLLLLLLSQE